MKLSNTAYGGLTEERSDCSVGTAFNSTFFPDNLKIDRENVEMIQYYKDNPVIQKALDALEQYCETSADKSVERQQETNRKKKQKSIYQGLHR